MNLEEPAYGRQTWQMTRSYRRNRKIHCYSCADNDNNNDIEFQYHSKYFRPGFDISKLKAPLFQIISILPS